MCYGVRLCALGRGGGVGICVLYGVSLGCEGSLCPGENLGHGFSQWGTGRNLCAVGRICVPWGVYMPWQRPCSVVRVSIPQGLSVWSESVFARETVLGKGPV